MNLTSELAALKNQTEELPLAERALLCCQLAKRLEKAGEYEASYEALKEFWPNRNDPPKLESLDDPTAAEVLLRAGALAGWLGSADQTEGSQETAKNLITNSIELFEKLGQVEKVAEARGDLALCYWREGSFDEARIHLASALSGMGNKDPELKAVLLIRAGIIEERTQQLQQALRFYYEAEPLLEKSEDHALKGAFHNEFALLFTRLGTQENCRDYLDRALIEAAAASFHFEEAGNSRYLARVENNLGYLFFTIGQYTDAHKHLDRARHLFLELKDTGTAAQVDDTRARTLLAEGRVGEAERLVRRAVKTLERGDEQAVLAEALTTHGTALGRLGNYLRSRAVLQCAVEIAETAGDLEGAGRAQLSIIEELGDRMPPRELVAIYRSAIGLLKHSEDPPTCRRLISCAEKLLDELEPSKAEDQESQDQTWEGFSLKKYVRENERAVIERALRDADSSVTRAARLLGFKHHQSLIYLINSRHKELLKTRSPVRKRRRALISKTTTKKVVTSAPTQTRQLSVLHVEDNELVARAVADTLSSEGMYVDSCSNGSTALKILKGNEPYDVIILDNGLPGISGLELVTRLRNIASRRRTPIIMLSGDDNEKDAWRVGVNAFLRKPDDIAKVSPTIARTLEEAEE
jgi:CheY-like chemotaxis protein/Flp pilus assembly protein TadD